jgi:hypothetical protein
VCFGLDDLSLFIPLLGEDPDSLDQEVFNFMFHMKQQWSDIMSWPSSVRRNMWRLFQEQREFDKKAARPRDIE